MHPELEALLEAWDAVQNSTGETQTRRLALYRARLEDAALAGGTPAERLARAVRHQHARWLRAQQRTSTLPPKA